MSRVIKLSITPDHETAKKRIEVKNIQFESQVENNPHMELRMREQETKQLLDQAKIQAESTIKEAKRHASNIIAEIEAQRQEWENEKAAQMKKAYEEGFQSGIEDGRMSGYAEYKESIDEAKSIVVSSKKAFHEHIENAETVILSLAISSAEKIIQSTLEREEHSFLPIVQSALKEARNFKEVQVHVHPSKYELLLSEKDELDAIFPAHIQCFIYPNEELEKDACWIESENGRIDASVSSQLIELKEQLLNLLNGAI